MQLSSRFPPLGTREHPEAVLKAFYPLELNLIGNNILVIWIDLPKASLAWVSFASRDFEKEVIQGEIMPYRILEECINTVHNME